MAHFIGGVEGNRGPASRLGTKRSGISVYAQGWDLGIRVYGRYDEEKDEDVFSVTLTSGSSHEGKSVQIGTFRRKNLNARWRASQRRIQRRHDT